MLRPFPVTSDHPVVTLENGRDPAELDRMLRVLRRRMGTHRTALKLRELVPAARRRAKQRLARRRAQKTANRRQAAAQWEEAA